MAKRIDEITLALVASSGSEPTDYADPGPTPARMLALAMQLQAALDDRMRDGAIASKSRSKTGE